MIDNKEVERMSAYLEAMANDPEKLRSILTTWSSETKEEYERLYNEVKRVNGIQVSSKNGNTTTTIGKPLEDLVEFIFEKSGIFKVYSNVRTRTNELDHVIMLKAYGKTIRKFGALDFEQDHVISECKNYKTTTSITYVGKFYALLDNKSTKLGIMFSYHGMTSTNGGWGAAKGLTKQLLLKRNENDKIYIIDFNKEHFDKLLDGKKSIVDIIEEEINKLKFDAYSFESNILPHDSEDSLEIPEYEN